MVWVLWSNIVFDANVWLFLGGKETYKWPEPGNIFQYIINEHFRTFWNSGISVDKYLNFFPKNAENFYTNILAPFLLSVAYYTRGGINLEGIWKSQI